MPDAQKAVTLVVGLLVAALMSAFILPIGIEAIAGGESQTAELNTSETTELQPGLNATLDSTTENTSATYTVDANGDSATTTVSEGGEETVTVDGADVTINVSTAGTDSATATFDSPKTYAWSGGASALWLILPVMIVLAVFLYFVSLAIREV